MSSENLTRIQAIERPQLDPEIDRKLSAGLALSEQEEAEHQQYLRELKSRLLASRQFREVAERYDEQPPAVDEADEELEAHVPHQVATTSALRPSKSQPPRIVSTTSCMRREQRADAPSRPRQSSRRVSTAPDPLDVELMTHAARLLAEAGSPETARRALEATVQTAAALKWEHSQ